MMKDVGKLVALLNHKNVCVVSLMTVTLGSITCESCEACVGSIGSGLPNQMCKCSASSYVEYVEQKLVC